MPDIGQHDPNVAIADLDYICTFPIVSHGTRTSLFCNRHATSLVIVPDAPRFSVPRKWRCDEHEGMIDDERRGETMWSLARSLAKALG